MLLRKVLMDRGVGRVYVRRQEETRANMMSATAELSGVGDCCFQRLTKRVVRSKRDMGIGDHDCN